MHGDVIGVKVIHARSDAFRFAAAAFQHLLLYLHLSLVAVLLMIFPFSKLLHAPGVFFSPSRNQADDSRENAISLPGRNKLESEN